MSKSYKKEPVVTGRIKGMKKFANRRIRNFKGEISNGSNYKKVFPSYDICDFAFRESYLEYETRRNKYQSMNIPHKDMTYYDWFKTYKRK
ncbi:hypothetical protein [Clostridium disporicum]|uniref:hypothetical protein n=1 Tax=Clostridium disporicum TaxID=84024 RepID=UPI0034A50487